jgi:hypothetical protein
MRRLNTRTVEFASLRVDIWLRIRSGHISNKVFLTAGSGIIEALSNRICRVARCFGYG